MANRDNLEMIKLHDGVAVNPLNVISVNLGKDSVYFAMANKRSHRFNSSDPRTLRKDFERFVKELRSQVDCVEIRHDILVAVDAICSVSKVEIGVAVNLSNENVEYIRCDPDEQDKLINRILKEIAQAA